MRTSKAATREIEMPARTPKTKAEKRKAAGDEMRKFYHGTLRSGSGHKVESPAQAKAIAMKVSGQSRTGKRGRRRARARSERR
jgi:hypothetical protein